MKIINWVALVAVAGLPLCCSFAQTPAAPDSGAAGPGTLSPAASEVVRMASANSGDDVLLAYIQNSTDAFSLSADNVLYLKDVGLSSQVITAMLNRDTALRGQPQTYNYNQSAYPPTVPPPAEMAPDSAPMPAAPVPAPAPAPAPVYASSPPADATYFYNDLSPYGTWVQLPDYGWCWQPTVVVINHGWRPYCDSGHWAYTDAGWYWASDYSWGWAPFHYGRWFLHERHGWVWAPDRVWGPAWVTWRTTDANCGWAPLPPRAEFVAGGGWRFRGVSVGLNFDFGLRADCFTFIAFGDFCNHDLGHRRLPSAEVSRIYNRTTVINNYTVVNNTFVNQGIKVERVAAATHTQIRKAVIRDLPAASSRTSRAQLADKSGLVVYRPQLQAPAKPGRMVAQQIDERHPVIQHPIPKASLAATPAQRPQTRTPVATPPAPRGTVPSSAGQQSLPAKSDSRAVPHSSATAPQSAPRSTPLEAPKTPVRSTPQEPSTRSMSSHPSAPAVPATPAPARASYESSQPARPAPTSRPNAAPQLYPLHSGSQPAAAASRTPPQEQSSHVYPPKTAHQAAEVHALPPINPRATTPSASSERPEKNQGSQSKRNE